MSAIHLLDAFVLCRLNEQASQLLQVHYHTLNFNSVTTLNDRHMAAVIRASTFSRLKTFKLEFS